MSYNVPQPSPRCLNPPQDSPSHPKHLPSHPTFALFNHANTNDGVSSNTLCLVEVVSGGLKLMGHKWGLKTLRLLGCSGHCRAGYDLMVCIMVHYIGQGMCSRLSSPHVQPGTVGPSYEYFWLVSY